MSTEEKVAQLLHPWGASNPDALFAQYGATGLGAMYLNWVSDSLSPQTVLAERNRLQRLFVEHSPHGIPVSIVIETLHGGGLGGTLFPMPVNFAATFNLSLAAAAFRLVAADARARGAERAFSPVVNMFSDARYGRLAEGFSEDPLVTTLFSLAIVAAMQGDAGGAGGGPDAYMRDTNASVLCTVKHFAAYGRGTGGIDGSPAVISPQLLNEVYLRPWRALAAAGLLRSVMAGQNAVNGVPMHAHAALLGPNGTLRHAWGVARALVESDGADCIGALMDFRVVATREDAAVLAVTAGVDVDLGALTLPLLVNASAKGKLPVEALDRAVGDVLTAKFSSGLFDAPYADPARLNPATLDPPASRALAREAATQSLTLLRNLDGLLPLQLSRGGQRVALLGLNANSTDALKGGYAQDGQLMVTVLAAFRAALGASVSFALGADPDAVVANETRLAEAVALAAASDVAVLVLGDSLTSCGEMYDTASFALAGAEQEALLARVAALAPRVKVVLVLLHARPVTFGGARGDALLSGVGALLAGFRLGEEGGSAVYDVVTGAANPSGKLPQAWPRSVGQVFGPASPYLYPFQGNHMYENYTDAPSSPLFAFGAGLSFSQWALADASATRGANGFAVRVTLRNVGARDGSQTVFVFAEDVICSVVRVASRQLVAFEKAGVPAGGSAALLLDVPLERLAVWIEAAGDWVLEPGEFVFYVALEGPGAQGAFPPSTIAVRVTV